MEILKFINSIGYEFILVTFIFIALDIISGVISSFITGTFKSSKMREGGKHKLLLLIVIVFGVALDVSQAILDMGFSLPCTSAICSYITFMEILSFIENVNLAFPNALPEALTNILYQTAKDKGVKVNDDENGK